MKRLLESAQQRVERLKKIYKIMRQKDAHKKKVFKDATRKRMDLSLKREIKFIY